MTASSPVQTKPSCDSLTVYIPLVSHLYHNFRLIRYVFARTNPTWESFSNRGHLNTKSHLGHRSFPQTSSKHHLKQQQNKIYCNLCSLAVWQNVVFQFSKLALFRIIWRTGNHMWMDITSDVFYNLLSWATWVECS